MSAGLATTAFHQNKLDVAMLQPNTKHKCRNPFVLKNKKYLPSLLFSPFTIWLIWLGKVTGHSRWQASILRRSSMYWYAPDPRKYRRQWFDYLSKICYPHLSPPRSPISLPLLPASLFLPPTFIFILFYFFNQFKQHKSNTLMIRGKQQDRPLWPHITGPLLD